MVHGIRFTVAACVVVFFVAGCGTSPTPNDDSVSTEKQTVIPADIDIDFCERRRGEVIEYVTRKYGRENVAQIITFGTMKARAVIRDVGRTLGMSYADVDRIHDFYARWRQPANDGAELRAGGIEDSS